MSLSQSLGLAEGNKGYRFACGTLIPASADVNVATGIAEVIACGVSLSDVPTWDDHLFSIAVPGDLASDVRIRSYGADGVNDADPVAALAPVAVTWWAVGENL